MRLFGVLVILFTLLTVAHSKCDMNSEIQTISNKMTYSKNKLISSLHKSIEYEDDIFFNKSMKVFLDEMNLLVTKLQSNVTNIISAKVLNECSDNYSLIPLHPTRTPEQKQSLSIEQILYYSFIILVMLILECVYFFVLYKISNRNVRVMLLISIINGLIVYIFVQLWK